jgi:uncharacterized membrane protein YhaH (DUF805 family)
MGWGAYLFGFKGCIGRGQMWLIYLLAGLVEFVPAPNGLEIREVRFRSLGALGGEGHFAYPQIVGPVTGMDWVMMVGYFILLVGAIWIIAAAMVKRLHDRGRSGKWLVVFFGGLTLGTVISVSLRNTGSWFIPLDIFNLIFSIALCAIGVFGAFEIFVMPGRNSRNDSATDRPGEVVNPTNG